MGACQRCGRCFPEPSPFEALKLKGYRMDDIESERWVFRSSAFLEGRPPVEDIPIDLD
jgi:hypothetical protein